VNGVGDALLTVDALSVAFADEAGRTTVLDDFSYRLEAGEILAIVGESGSGKSVGALAVMGLIGRPGRVTGGSVRLGGRELLTLSEREMQQVRGGRIGMIFQEPMTSLNPVLTVAEQIGEAVRLHTGADKRAARRRALEMLKLVQIPEPGQRLDQYPHELSGGMSQRVMIAMAMSCAPSVLIADEPTTALDVTVQAQILELMRDIRRRTGTAIVLITHDLGVVAELADRVLVVYAGRKVEEGPVRAVLRAPRHPYTEGLLRAMPHLGGTGDGGRLAEIPGQVPSPAALPPGCAFAPRCPLAVARCRRELPPLEPVDGSGHESACWRSDDMANKR